MKVALSTVQFGLVTTKRYVWWTNCLVFRFSRNQIKVLYKYLWINIPLPGCWYLSSWITLRALMHIMSHGSDRASQRSAVVVLFVHCRHAGRWWSCIVKRCLHAFLFIVFEDFIILTKWCFRFYLIEDVCVRKQSLGFYEAQQKCSWIWIYLLYFLRHLLL